MKSPRKESYGLPTGIDRIRNSVFDIPMTNKFQVADLFEELDERLDLMIETSLLHIPMHLQTQITQRLAYVFNGHISNKNVLRICPKSFNFNSVKAKDQKLIQNIKFCVADFVWATRLKDYASSLQSLRKLKLHRSVLESVIEDIYHRLDRYRQLVSRCGKLHNRILTGLSDESVTREYNQILKRVYALESEYMASQSMLVGTFNQLDGLMTAYYSVREQLATPYLRLVYSIANKLSKQEGHVEDNFQNGVTGLYKAISNFDITKKTNFSTYAKPWIRQSIMANISQENIIRVPASTWREQAAYVKDLSSGKSLSDTALKHGVKVGHIEQIMHKADIGQVMRVDWSSFTGDLGESIPFDEYYRDDSKTQYGEMEQETPVELSLTEQEDLILFLTEGIDTVHHESPILPSHIEQELQRQLHAKNFALGNSR